MFLGIDVGGTFTDAVVIGENRLLAFCKRPTMHNNLLSGMIAAIDEVLTGLDPAKLKRVAFSTTIVTNTLVEGKADPAALFIMAGPGMNYQGLMPVEPYLLSGYIDHRGREVAPPKRDELQAAIRSYGTKTFAVAGKFSVRNPVYEQQVAAWLSELTGAEHITQSCQVSGSLNLWRRANAAYYNAAVWRHYGYFADAVDQALKERSISAPVYILKADGGTMPLSSARSLPVETIFTGPAASVLGIMTICRPDKEAVSLDIGGTTTDIALWRDGQPLSAAKGAAIDGYPTSVQAFRLKSVGIGGDSWVRREDGQLIIGPQRQGSAMALGGPVPTLSDAMIVAGCSHFGEERLALEAMKQVAQPGETPQQAACNVIEKAASAIAAAVRSMIADQAAEPVYRVDDILNQAPLKPTQLIGIGGAAPGLAPIVAGQLGAACLVPAFASVANAAGAAAAKPTIDITLRADTSQGSYTVAELGMKEKLPGRQMRLEQVRELARTALGTRASQLGIAMDEASIVYEEEFNLVRGFSAIGRSITCRLQVKPGAMLALGKEGHHGE